MAEVYGTAQKLLRLEIFDENNMHVVTLELKGKQGMTPGDMHQLQNVFWCTIGRFVRDNTELQEQLLSHGISVYKEPREEPEQEEGGLERVPSMRVN